MLDFLTAMQQFCITVLYSTKIGEAPKKAGHSFENAFPMQRTSFVLKRDLVLHHGVICFNHVLQFRKLVPQVLFLVSWQW